MKKDGGGKEPVDTKPKMDEGKKLTELTPAQKAMKDRAQGTDRKRGEFPSRVNINRPDEFDHETGAKPKVNMKAKLKVNYLKLN